MIRESRFAKLATAAITLGMFVGLMGCEDYPQNEDPLAASDIHKLGVDSYGGTNTVVDNSDVVNKLANSSRSAVPATAIPATAGPATTTYSTSQEAAGSAERGNNTTAPAVPVP